MDNLLVNMDLKKLPSKYDVVHHLFSKAIRPDSKKMLQEINKYSKVLIDLWCKSFGSGHNITLRTVKIRLKALVKEYFNGVYIKAHQMKKKHHNKCSCKGCIKSTTSQRVLQRAWKLQNSGLFDIGYKMDELEGDEKLFYEDQKTGRVGRLDDIVDEEYEQEQQRIRQAAQDALEQEQADETFVMQDLENEQVYEDTVY